MGDCRLEYGQVSTCDVVCTHHSHSVQLLKRTHGLEQQNNHTTSFDGLNGSCKGVGRNSFKVLEHTHAIRVTENLLRLLIVGVSDVGDGHKQFKWVLGVGFSDTSFNILLDLCLSLLSVSTG